MKRFSNAPGGSVPARLVGWSALAILALFALANVQPSVGETSGRNRHSHLRVDSGYRLVPGPWPVKAIDRLVLDDKHRAKKVEMTVRYPAGKAGRNRTFPLVVFVAATGDPRSAFPDLTTHWASYGYVVIVLSPAETPPIPRRHWERAAYDVAALDRLADVVFVLDGLDQVERKLDGFHGRHAARVDRARAGIAGHSAGALTAQMAVGVKVRLSRDAGEPEFKSVGDARFKAAVLMSGQSTINRMLTRESWADLAAPLLVITGSRDVAPTSRETPESRQEPFTLARPGDKYLVFIDGATPASYSAKASAVTGAADGRDEGEPDLRMISAVTASATLAFWDAYLPHDEAGRQYLAGDDLARLADGRARLARR